jgi:hypothetical protein
MSNSLTRIPFASEQYVTESVSVKDQSPDESRGSNKPELRPIFLSERIDLDNGPKGTIGREIGLPEEERAREIGQEKTYKACWPRSGHRLP